MEKKKENFEYRVKNVQLAFPIDYALREYEKEFNQERRAFSQHILQHTLVKNILWELTISTKNIEKYPYVMPTIPLEAIPLLNCFYRLGKQGENEKNGYHAVFFCREFDDKYNMNNFWNDLCVELYNFTAPPKNDNEKDFYAFCRHKLFQNEKFASSLLSRIWKEEMMARYKMIQKLRNRVDMNVQLSILKNCLMNLDRSIFDLQINANSKPLKPVSVTSDSISALLKSLLSVRQDSKNADEEPFSYDLPNISLPDGTTLDQAFHDIARRGKLVNQTKPQLKMARESYMSHLAKKIEMDFNAQDSLELERQYIRLQNYLAAPSSWSSDNLFDKVQERCKQYCRQVINYCSCEPVSRPFFVIQPYKDDLLDYLIYERMSQKLNGFQDTFQLVISHNVSQATSYSCRAYERLKLLYLEKCIRSRVKSEEDSKFLLEKVQDLMEDLGLPLLPNTSNIFYENMRSFCLYFERTWEFIYDDAIPLFKLGTYCFQNRVDVAYKLWRDGGTAARFFSNEKPTFESLAFPSQEEADQALAICERIASNSDRLFPPFKFWDSISNIFQVLLIQILQKIVVDNVPKWVENIKPLLVSSKKPNP